MKYFIFDEDANPIWYTYIQAFIMMFVIMPAVGIAIIAPIATVGDAILTRPHYHSR